MMGDTLEDLIKISNGRTFKFYDIGHKWLEIACRLNPSYRYRYVISLSGGNVIGDETRLFYLMGEPFDMYIDKGGENFIDSVLEEGKRAFAMLEKIEDFPGDIVCDCCDLVIITSGMLYRLDSVIRMGGVEGVVSFMRSVGFVEQED